MIEYLEGKGLWGTDEAKAEGQLPFMVVRCIVRGSCDCWVACGLLTHNREQGVSWHPCDAHRMSQPGNPQDRFLRSLHEDPQARPVEEVIEEMLA